VSRSVLALVLVGFIGVTDLAAAEGAVPENVKIGGPANNAFATLESAAAKSNPLAPKAVWAGMDADTKAPYTSPRLWSCMKEADKSCTHAKSYSACVSELSAPCVKMFGEMALFCNHDFAQYCPGKQLGLPATFCLGQHAAELTTTCSKMLKQESDHVEGMWRCYIDVRSSCGGKADSLFGGNGSLVEAIECIRQSRPQLVPQCDLLPGVSSACVEDVRRYCKDEKTFAGASLCLAEKMKVKEDHLSLKDNVELLSEGCRNTFAAINDLYIHATTTDTDDATSAATNSIKNADRIYKDVNTTGAADGSIQGSKHAGGTEDDIEVREGSDGSIKITNAAANDAQSIKSAGATVSPTEGENIEVSQGTDGSIKVSVVHDHDAHAAQSLTTQKPALLPAADTLNDTAVPLASAKTHSHVSDTVPASATASEEPTIHMNSTTEHSVPIATKSSSDSSLQLVLHGEAEHFAQHRAAFKAELIKFLGVSADDLALDLIPHMHAVNVSFVPDGKNIKMHVVRPVMLGSTDLQDDKTIVALERALSQLLHASHSSISVAPLTQTCVILVTMSGSRATEASHRLETDFSLVSHDHATPILAAIPVEPIHSTALIKAVVQANHLVHIAKGMHTNGTVPATGDDNSVLLTMRGDIHQFGPVAQAALVQSLAKQLKLKANLIAVKPLAGSAIVRISILGIGGKVQREMIQAVQLGPSKTATLGALRSALAQMLATSVQQVQVRVLAGSFTVKVQIGIKNAAKLAESYNIILKKANYPGKSWLLGNYMIDSAMRGESSQALQHAIVHWKNPSPVAQPPHVVETDQARAQDMMDQTSHGNTHGFIFATRPPAGMYGWSGDMKPSNHLNASEECTTPKHGLKYSICGTSVAGARFHLAADVIQISQLKPETIALEIAALLHIPLSHVLVSISSGSVIVTVVFKGEGTHGIELVRELTLIFSSEEDSPRLAGCKVIMFETPLPEDVISRFTEGTHIHGRSIVNKPATTGAPAPDSHAAVSAAPVAAPSSSPQLDAARLHLNHTRDALHNASMWLEIVRTNISAESEEIQSLEGERVMQKYTEMEANKMMHEDDAVAIEDSKFQTLFDNLDQKKRHCRTAFATCKGFKCQNILKACIDHARSGEYTGFKKIIQEEILLVERISAAIVQLDPSKSNSSTSSSSSTALEDWRTKLMVFRFRLIDQKKQCEAPYEQCVRTQLSSTPCDLSKKLEHAVLCMQSAHRQFKSALHPLLPNIIAAGKHLEIKVRSSLFDNKRSHDAAELHLSALQRLLPRLEERLKALQVAVTKAEASIQVQDVRTVSPVEAAEPAALVTGETVVVLNLKGSAAHFNQAQIGLIYTELSKLLGVSPDRIDVKLMTNTGDVVKVMVTVSQDTHGAILKKIETAAHDHKLNLLPYHFPFISMQVLMKPKSYRVNEGPTVAEWQWDESVAILQFAGQNVVNFDQEQKKLHAEIAQYLMIAPPRLSTHAVAEAHLVAAPRLKVIVSITSDTAGTLMKKLLTALKDGSFAPAGLTLTGVKLLHHAAAAPTAPPALKPVPLTKPISNGLYSTYQAQEAASVSKKREACESEYQKCLASPFCHKAFGEQQRKLCILTTEQKFVHDEQKSLAWLDSLMKKEIGEVDGQIISSSSSAPSDVALAEKLHQLRSAMTHDLHGAQTRKSDCEAHMTACTAGSGCDKSKADADLEVCLQRVEDHFVKGIIGKFDEMVAALHRGAPPSSSPSDAMHQHLKHKLHHTFEKIGGSSSSSASSSSDSAQEMKCHRSYTSCVASEFCDMSYAKQQLALCLATVLQGAMGTGCGPSTTQQVPCTVPIAQPCAISTQGCNVATAGSTVPTALPSLVPTVTPTAPPTQTPTVTPTVPPTPIKARPIASHVPSTLQTVAPTTSSPTTSPSETTTVPSANPSAMPTNIPSDIPSVAPTRPPTYTPTVAPTQPPTYVPSFSPSEATQSPTFNPSFSPSTDMPTTPTPTMVQ
jgi:hypothetical protein